MDEGKLGWMARKSSAATLTRQPFVLLLANFAL